MDPIGAAPARPKGDPTMRDLRRTLRDLWVNEEAASMVEYVLLVALIAAVAAAGFATFGTAVSDESTGKAAEVGELLTP